MVDLLTKKLLNMENVIFGYLFGSYSQDKQTAASDVDIALFLKDTGLDARLQVNYELSKFLKKDIDLVLLNDIKNIYLLEDILKYGIVIKESEQRFDFEITKQHDILDYKVFRKFINAA